MDFGIKKLIKIVFINIKSNRPWKSINTYKSKINPKITAIEKMK